MSSNSGEVSSFVDSIRDKKAALLNKLNSSNSQMTKSSSSSRTLHTVSSQEENRTSNFSRSISLSSDASQVRMSSNSGQRKYSIDSLDNKTEEPVPIVTEPDSPQSGITSPNFEGQSPKTQPKMVVNNGQMVASNKSKLQTNDANYEKVTSMSKETKRLQSVDRTIEEKRRAAEFKQKLETDNVKAEKKGIISQEKKQLISSDIFKQSQKSASAASANVQIHSSKDEYSAKKMAVSQQEERQMISSTQGITHEKHVASASSSKMTFMSKSASTSNSSLASHNLKNLENAAASVASGLSMLNGSLMEGFAIGSPTKLSITNESPEDELDRINSFSESDEVNLALARCTRRMASCVEKLKTASDAESIPILDNMSELILRAWAVHTHGHDLGYSLCNVLRNNGGLDILMRNCSSDNTELQFSSARVLEQCLTTENRAHVVENGLDKVVRAACNANRRNIVTHSRVGSGILEHLFKHSESACGEVIQLGGLDAILYECRSSDIETLRHCAAALANLSLYGGGDNQQSMIKSKVPVWLFPLAFHNDDNIKYYACMAIAALVANKEVEAAVIRSGTLNLVEPFVTSHNPKEFAASSASHVHGQSKNWLQRLVHVLKSKREEARNLAAFHFAMEAGIKRKQGNTKFFHEIGAVDALKKVASSPNAIASKYAAHALRLIGEEVPHKLSQQVPLWTVEDVTEWVKQIGFGHHSTDFLNSRVDGDLLLQMEEENLCDDIGIRNGILRRRFMRELNELKKMSDYSSCDPENLYLRLQNIYPELCKYAYTMIKSGVSSDNIMQLNDDQLRKECGIDNSIHRIKVLDSIRGVSQSYGNITNDQDTSNVNKNLDVFISYRRSNGSQLASLLKVHLQLRGFSVFIDVERLEAGKFDNNLLQSVRQAKHFILVLTPNALDRCIGDDDTKDWVHREIYAALQSKCNIIPIIDNFQWPESEKLPDDIRAVCYFNGVRWIHDYQDACVDKLERFMRGEMNSKSDGHGRYAGAMTPSTPSSTLGNRGHAGLFQRSTSNENNSDKDSNGSHATPSHH